MEQLGGVAATIERDPVLWVLVDQPEVFDEGDVRLDPLDVSAADAAVDRVPVADDEVLGVDRDHGSCVFGDHEVFGVYDDVGPGEGVPVKTNGLDVEHDDVLGQVGLGHG